MIKRLLVINIFLLIINIFLAIGVLQGFMVNSTPKYGYGRELTRGEAIAIIERAIRSHEPYASGQYRAANGSSAEWQQSVISDYLGVIEVLKKER